MGSRYVCCAYIAVPTDNSRLSLRESSEHKRCFCGAKGDYGKPLDRTILHNAHAAKDDSHRPFRMHASPRFVPDDISRPFSETRDFFVRT